MADPQIVAWDIEASNLNADFGVILCVGFKEVEGRRPWVLSIIDYMGEDGDLIRAEKRLLKDVSKDLMKYPVWLTHYGGPGRYDLPFVNSRLIYHNLQPLPVNYPMIDTWKISRNHLKLRNNRLVTIQQFLKLHDSKNAIQPEQWLRALSGHVPSMRYIVNHCRRDVLVLEQTYLRIRPLVLEHPHMGMGIRGVVSCPNCGGTHLHKRGFHLTRTRRYQRYQCRTCGSWTKSAKWEKASG